MEYVMIYIAIAIGIYLAIATTLVIIDGKPKEIEAGKPVLNFEELNIDYTGIPELQEYKTRYGSYLNLRCYPSESKKILILLHGSGLHSKYLYPLASYISYENIAKVYTPDLRGHGANPKKRGEIEYITQLEDDIADLIEMIKVKNPNAKIFLGGHAAGGGLVIRFAAGRYANLVRGYIMLSPFLKHNAPTMRTKSGDGWAHAHTPRIAGLSMFNKLWIPLFNHLPVIDINIPKEHRDGSETLTYSYGLNKGYTPKNYKKNLMRMHGRALIAVGTQDEFFVAEKFRPEVSKYKSDIQVVELEGVSHMGIITRDGAHEVIKNWLRDT